jgi:branched-chain amino acid transport system ATP-binding protein
MNILEVEAVTKSFGGLRAIDDLSLTVRSGQCFGIIGANGAGKTTLLNLITGYASPNTGSIRFDGHVVTGLPPYELCRLGMGRSFQIVQPFAEMTVIDNVMTGALYSRNGRGRSLAQARTVCEQALELVGLTEQANDLAGSLTIGRQKKLELARVLATEPKLMLLDEVMGGLTRGEIEDCIATLERIKATGATIVMIEHHVHVITRLCDHVFVLDFGRALFEGTPADVIAHPEVIQAYLGKPQETQS